MKPYTNVQESWPIYDTVLISPVYYGKEQNQNGWFTSFLGFSQQESHQFYKARTAGSSHLAYNNMGSADNIDFVYKAYSFGVRFFAPVCPDGYYDTITDPNKPTIRAMQESLNAFWIWDLPRHCGVDLRVQQDVVLENCCMATPPGYGPRGGGGVQSGNLDLDHYALNSYFESQGEIVDSYWWWQQQAQDPWQVVIGSQSEPVIDCRFLFPNPIKIPRNSTIEANIYVGLYARNLLAQLYNGYWNFLSSINMSPPNYCSCWTCNPAGPYITKEYVPLPPRYGIQCSLYGLREVQQRGQYFAPGAISEINE